MVNVYSTWILWDVQTPLIKKIQIPKHLEIQNTISPHFSHSRRDAACICEAFSGFVPPTRLHIQPDKKLPVLPRCPRPRRSGWRRVFGSGWEREVWVRIFHEAIKSLWSHYVNKRSFYVYICIYIINKVCIYMLHADVYTIPQIHITYHTWKPTITLHLNHHFFFTRLNGWGPLGKMVGKPLGWYP